MAKRPTLTDITSLTNSSAINTLSQNWQNTSPANTFAPGVFGWTVV